MDRKKRILAAAAALFAALFAARLAWELTRTRVNPAPFGAFGQMELDSSSVSERRNFASAKIAVDQAPSGTQVVEQKYERVSQIESRTEHWDSDIAAVKLAIDGAKALVQRENSYGLDGERVSVPLPGRYPGRLRPHGRNLEVHR